MGSSLMVGFMCGVFPVIWYITGKRLHGISYTAMKSVTHVLARLLPMSPAFTAENGP